MFLASDFTGLFEGVLWYGVHGFYLIMLLINAISSVGQRRYSRANEHFGRSLVWGGLALALSLAVFIWGLLGKSQPDWRAIACYAAISLVLCGLAVLLRWYQRRL